MKYNGGRKYLVAMTTSPRSCKERVFCLVSVIVVVVVFLLPIIFFYSWRDSEVNNWRNQTDLLEVYNYIHDCNTNVTAKENSTQVRIDLIVCACFLVCLHVNAAYFHAVLSTDRLSPTPNNISATNH